MCGPPVFVGSKRTQVQSVAQFSQRTPSIMSVSLTAPALFPHTSSPQKLPPRRKKTHAARALPLLLLSSQFKGFGGSLRKAV